MDKKLLRLTPLTEASFYVLLSLQEPSHGYGVIKRVEEMTNNRMIIAAGTLYGIISSFLKHGLITLIDESGTRSKKVYQSTSQGKELLEYEIQRLNELLTNAREIFR